MDKRTSNPQALRGPCTPGQHCTAEVPCLAHVDQASERMLDTPEARAADLASVPGDVDMAGPGEDREVTAENVTDGQIRASGLDDETIEHAIAADPNWPGGMRHWARVHREARARVVAAINARRSVRPVTGPDGDNPITDEQIEELRAEYRVRKHGGNASIGRALQMFPPLKWVRLAPGVYHGSRRGWTREYAIQRRGHDWHVGRRHEKGELAMCGSYRGAKQWAQHLADGSIKGTPEWAETRARCAAAINARRGGAS